MTFIDSHGEVAALDHEVGNDAVELGALVVQGLAGLADSLLAGAEGAEVLDRLGDGLAEEAEFDTADFLAINADVEEDGVSNLGGLLLRLQRGLGR